MAIASANGKYMALENVRVFYDKDSDKIIITSKDPDIPIDSKGFKISVNSDNETGSTLRQMLGERGIIPEYQKDISPEKVMRSEIPTDYPWYMIPIGKSSTTDITVWDTQQEHNMFIVGWAGSGKTNIVYNIVEHCLTHSDKWEVAVFDIIWGNEYADTFPLLSDVGLTLEDVRTGLNRYLEELHWREENPSTTNKEILLVVDGLAYYAEVLTKRPHQMYKEIGEALLRLAERGKAVGIHLLITSQNLYHNPCLPFSQLLPQFKAKVVCGQYDRVGLAIFTREAKPIHLKPRKGRAYMMNSNGTQIFQTTTH